MPTVEIIEPGLSTTVQDRGRFGHYHLGIPQGGAMDAMSAAAGNALVGNTPDDAVLECTYLGPNLRFTEDTIVAVTGAPVTVSIDGTEVPEWTQIDVPAGSVLSFGIIAGGSRFYIAVRGGIDVPVVLGSRSTYPAGRLGGHEGRALQKDDVLPVGTATNPLPEQATTPENLRPGFTREQNIRIVMGLYDQKLTETGRDNITGGEWMLTPVADRAGLRFKGPGVEWKDEPQPFGAGADPSNIVDAGYAVGSIQIPGGTQPIVLHRDAVSGGGYAMVGTVISADMDLVARLAPGTKIHFVEVTMDEALAAREVYREQLAALWV